MLEPTGEEEAGTGQLVGLVQIAGPRHAAAVAARSFVHLSCLVVVVPFLHQGPIHRAAAAKSFRAAAAGTGIVGVGFLLV